MPSTICMCICATTSLRCSHGVKTLSLCKETSKECTSLLLPPSSVLPLTRTCVKKHEGVYVCAATAFRSAEKHLTNHTLISRKLPHQSNHGLLARPQNKEAVYTHTHTRTHAHRKHQLLLTRGFSSSENPPQTSGLSPYLRASTSRPPVPAPEGLHPPAAQGLRSRRRRIRGCASARSFPREQGPVRAENDRNTNTIAYLGVGFRQKGCKRAQPTMT